MSRFARLALVATILAAGAATAQTPAPVDQRTRLGLSATGPITGAGSTFALPLIGRWAQLYRSAKSDGAEMVPTEIGVEYEPIGSLGGEVRVTQRAVDFGASDRPVSSEELARTGLIQFPFVMGGIVPVVNLDGVGPGQIRFTGELLADIYLGKVKSWSDPAIKAVNPDLKLLDAAINVIWRSDDSGTTFNWTDYLARSSPEWAGRFGANTTLPWPTGAGAERSHGVIAAIGRIKNAIGYVELGQVQRANLAFALLQNKAGQFVRPDAASLQAAAASADWPAAKDFSLLLTDAPGPQAWPIVATTFALVPKPLNTRSREAINFFAIGLEKGAADAAALGYIPLPEPLVKQIRAYWAAALRPAG